MSATGHKRSELEAFHDANSSETGGLTRILWVGSAGELEKHAYVVEVCCKGLNFLPFFFCFSDCRFIYSLTFGGLCGGEVEWVHRGTCNPLVGFGRRFSLPVVSLFSWNGVLSKAECSCLIGDTEHLMYGIANKAVGCTSDYRITNSVVDCISPELQSLQVAHLMYTITEFQLHIWCSKLQSCRQHIWCT